MYSLARALQPVTPRSPAVAAAVLVVAGVVVTAYGEPEPAVERAASPARETLEPPGGAADPLSLMGTALADVLEPHTRAAVAIASEALTDAVRGALERAPAAAAAALRRSLSGGDAL